LNKSFILIIRFINFVNFFESKNTPKFDLFMGRASILNSKKQNHKMETGI